MKKSRTPKRSSGSSGIVTVVLIVALVAACGCGFWFMQQSKNDSAKPKANDKPEATIVVAPKQKVEAKTKKLSAESLEEADYVKVSSPAQPNAYYAILEQSGSFGLVIRVANTYASAKAPLVTVGFGNGKQLRLSSKDARYFVKNGLHHYVFQISGQSAKVKKFNMAFSAEWPDGPYGKALRKELYMITAGFSSPHDPLGSDKNDWALVNLEDYRTKLADRRNVIKIEFEQKFPGKATIVINDEKGNRIRNLISGEKQNAGLVSVEWDGCDDGGNLVKPGKYSWKTIYHPGIVAKYQMRYADGYNTKWKSFGSNHGLFLSATIDQNYIYLASPITEGGWAMVAFDENGKWIKGFNEIHGTGYSAIATAIDDKYYYAAHEGPTPGQNTRGIKRDANPELEYGINITRYDLETQRPVPYKGQSFVWVDKFKHAKKEPQKGLQGMVLLDGLLYISCWYNNAVIILDAATLERKGTIPLKNPGAMTLAGKSIFVQSGDNICRLDPKQKKKSTVLKGIKTAGLFFDDATKILYSSNPETHQVDVYKGKEKVKSIGITGGPYQGKFIPGRMVNPRGLAMFKGKLWVTENRRNPKRALAWGQSQKNVVIELFGNPPYGGSGAGFDYADTSKFIGLRGMWDVDLKGRKADFASIFQKSGGHFGGYYNWAYRYAFHHEAGRTFLVGAGFINTVSELMPDGSLKDLAACSVVGSFRYGCGWKPPEEFEKAVTKHVAKIDPEGKLKDHEVKSLGVFWRDRNSDGLCQENEFDFSNIGENISGTRWGHVINGITYTLPVTVQGEAGFIVMKPDGFDKNGVPKYPTLKQAFAKVVKTEKPVSLGQYGNIRAESLTDRFGNLFVNSSPNMVGFSPKGKMLWFFKNEWVGVHGSHKAPLPQVGQMQGCLFYLGRGELDDKADVFMLNGNHGRYFVLTSDGFYLDEMFNDVRMGAARDDMLIGGEAFGGFFSKSKQDGKYYLITGSSGYRIYRIDGLDKIVRVSGQLDVTQEQLIACDRKLKTKHQAEAKDAVGVAGYMSKSVKIDGRDREWPRTNYLKWSAGAFKPEVRVGWDKSNLYLLYRVSEDSPWVNKGKDWQSLFKTGDSIDLQIATDRHADKRRKGPVPGDIRVLIAPYGDSNIAVLYQHRLKGKGKDRNPVKFTSPWRSETVDNVTRLENAKIAVNKETDRYTVEVSIPLADLGLNPGSNSYQADVGVIFGDKEGTIDLLRSYWSNKATGLVNDVPGEIMLSPNLWGTIKLEGGK